MRRGNADLLLLAAAREIACERGCSGLRIRDVADRAGVNLGMFHYHFRNKKRFTRALMQDLYEDFFSKLSTASRDGKDGITQLRNTLLVVGRFNRDNRALLAALIKDVLNGDREVLHFVRENAPRHLDVLRQLIRRCQSEGSIVRLPDAQLLSLLMTGLNFPNLVAGIIEREWKGPRTRIKTGMDSITSDHAIAQRLDILLRGLKP